MRFQLKALQQAAHHDIAERHQAQRLSQSVKRGPDITR
jgi:hypothetical protein